MRSKLNFTTASAVNADAASPVQKTQITWEITIKASKQAIVEINT